MWVGHFAPALVLKRFAPQTPVTLLALAGALPDFLFMVFAVFGLEEIHYHEYRGCFPYQCNYPFTHSLVGIAAIGVVFGGLVTAALSLPRVSFFALVAATLTHWPLDLLVHRADMSFTTSPNRWLFGTYLFNFPILIFILDLGLVLSALLFHKMSNVPTGPDASAVYMTWVVMFTMLQADFSFYGAPTKQARWLHAPLFAGQIVAIVWGMSFLDKHTRPLLESPPPTVREVTDAAKGHARVLVNTGAEKMQQAVNTGTGKVQDAVNTNNEKIAQQQGTTYA